VKRGIWTHVKHAITSRLYPKFRDPLANCKLLQFVSRVTGVGVGDIYNWLFRPHPFRDNFFFGFRRVSVTAS
jgi:hypothetical protein